MNPSAFEPGGFQAMLPHIFAGLLAITAGALALFAAKGERLHRRSGTVFVCAMLVMGAVGAAMAATKLHIPFQRMNVVAGVLVCYLVTTGFLTIRRRTPGSPWMDAGAMSIALAVGIFAVKFGLDGLSAPGGKLIGFSTTPAFVFGGIALLAALGDMRMIRAGGLQGSHRLTRHLWRMCFALFIATASFFMGQMKVFPDWLRIPALLAIPAFLPLLAMLFWLARVWIMKRPVRWNRGSAMANRSPSQPAGFTRGRDTTLPDQA